MSVASRSSSCPWILLLCLTLCCLAGATAARAEKPTKAGQSGYHVASTDAEKALDRVLRLSEKDENLVEFLLQTPGYKKNPNQGYTRYFTKKLLAATAAMERAAVMENCQGHYTPDEICGVDYNPLTCAQDFADGAYLYNTESSGPAAAAISYKWPDQRKPAAHFEMVREDGQWKVDTVQCLP